MSRRRRSAAHARLARAARVAAITAASAPLLVALGAGSARAEPSENSSNIAEGMFQDARRLMDAHKYAEACPKFAASEKLAPGVGTLLNLADCYEKNGQLASALTRFREALGMAQHLGRKDRERTAQERIDKLEPRVPRVKLTSQDTSIDIKIDGAALEAAVLGTAVPIDPGKHTIDVAEKGKKPWSKTFEVGDQAKETTLEIPALEDAPPETTPPPGTPGDRTVPPDEDANANPGGTQRILGIVGMGLGVVGIGVGAFFGFRTQSQWNDSKAHCNGIDCDVTGVQLATDAKNAGTTSTIAFIAGGLFAAGGAALFFTAPRSSAPSTPDAKPAPAPTTALGVGPGSFFVRGTF